MLARRQDAAAPVVPATTGRRPVVGTVDHRGRVAGMRGKAVLVTGASSGIGLAASRHLAGLGAELVMVSRDPIRGAAARDEVAKVALGIADNQALTLLCENVATKPLVVFPRINAGHARHPAWAGHLAALASAGVSVVYGPDVWPLFEPREAPPDRAIPWAEILRCVSEAIAA